MNLKGWSILTATWLLLAPAAGYSADEIAAMQEQDPTNDKSGRLPLSPDLPAWLRNTHINFDFNHRQSSPLWFQPIYTEKRDSFFIQGHLGDSNDESLNLGLGYRRLMPGMRWLLGANAWYDHSFDFDNERIGLGIEAIGKHITLRSNYYTAISGWKPASLTSDISSHDETQDGWNLELEAPVPYVPWARLSLRSFERGGETTTNTDGHSLEVRLNPSNNLELEMGVVNDSASSTEAFTRLIWHFGRSNTSGTLKLKD